MSTMQTSFAGAGDALTFEALEKYPWDDDVEFQSGLSAILGPNSPPDQANELALRARCFYYARKFNVSVDFDSYKAYRERHASAPPSTSTNGLPTSTGPPLTGADPSGGILPAPSSNASEPPAPYPTSFAHIVELITTGQPIPGIKDIPNTILEGQGTEAVKPKRRKPWEKDEAPAAPASSVEEAQATDA